MFEPRQTATRDRLLLERTSTMTRLPRKNPPHTLQSPGTGRISPVHSPTQTCTPIQPGTQSSGKQSLTGKRLQKHADYRRAYAASRKRQSASMSWFLARQAPAYAGAELPAGPRVGLTAGKVVGQAHERNRIKRRMREALRRHIDMLPTGFDLILHPRRFVLTLEFAKLEAEIVRILHQVQAEAARMSQEAPAI